MHSINYIIDAKIVPMNGGISDTGFVFKQTYKLLYIN